MTHNKDQLSITTVDLGIKTSVHQWHPKHQHWIDKCVSSLKSAVYHEGRLRAIFDGHVIVFEKEGIFEEVCHWKIFHGDLQLFGYTLMLEHGTEAADEMWSYYVDWFKTASRGEAILPPKSPQEQPWLLVWAYQDTRQEFDLWMAGDGPKSLSDAGHVATVVAWTLMRSSWVQDTIAREDE